MANEKILILEAPWSDDIENTKTTREIYTSAETLLRLGPHPIRIIPYPLVSATYRDVIKHFTNLQCNKHGPNVIVLSAHGSHTLSKENKNRRHLVAFDGEINISREFRLLKGNLGRTIIVLDSCEVGTNIKSFRNASGALGVIGFTKDVSWVDSPVFILAVLLHFQEEGVFHLERDRNKTIRDTIKTMLEGMYKSFETSLGIEYSI